jgi:hypothetical protein
MNAPIANPDAMPDFAMTVNAVVIRTHKFKLPALAWMQTGSALGWLQVVALPA